MSMMVKTGAVPPVVATQVKEKSGYLRFYIRERFNRVTNSEALRLIELTQQKAEITCEQCGQPAAQRALDHGAVLRPACTAKPPTGCYCRNDKPAPTPKFSISNTTI